VRASLAAPGFSGAVSCAPTAPGAWMLAKRGGGQALSMRSLETRVNPVLIAPPARRHADWFDGTGCITLAQPRRLRQAVPNNPAVATPCPTRLWCGAMPAREDQP